MPHTFRSPHVDSSRCFRSCSCPFRLATRSFCYLKIFRGSMERYTSSLQEGDFSPEKRWGILFLLLSVSLPVLFKNDRQTIRSFVLSVRTRWRSLLCCWWLLSRYSGSLINVRLLQPLRIVPYGIPTLYVWQQITLSAFLPSADDDRMLTSRWISKLDRSVILYVGVIFICSDIGAILEQVATSFLCVLFAWWLTRFAGHRFRFPAYHQDIVSAAPDPKNRRC